MATRGLVCTIVHQAQSERKKAEAELQAKQEQLHKDQEVPRSLYPAFKMKKNTSEKLELNSIQYERDKFWLG